jgi:hypothetical protein
MKKISISLTVVFLNLILMQTTKAQTNVRDTIYSNTTWTKVRNPYIVVDTLVIVFGATLTIEPGVIVKFNDHQRIELQGGRLIAQGTLNDSITFTSNSISPTPGIFSGIIFNDRSLYIPHHSSKFNYCNFQFAEYGINRVGIYNFEDTLIVNNCSIKNNIIGLSNFYLDIISNCTINSNQIGLYNIQSQRITNCTINSNQIGLLNPNSSEIDNCVIDSNQIAMKINYLSWVINSKIRHNQYGIIDSAGQFYLKNCIIDSNIICGIKLYGNIILGEIYNCHFSSNGIGIIDSSLGNSNVITRNIIEKNSIGIELSNPYDEIHCNKICNNTAYNIKYLSASNIDVSHNYWCTQDSSSTEETIYDGYDTVSLGFMNYMPLDTVQCFQCNYLTISIETSGISCPTCSDGTATAYVENGTPPYTYEWNTTPLQTTQTITELPAGLYTVCITDSAGCPACGSLYITYGMKVNEITDNIPFSIFPNPTSNYLTLLLPVKNEKLIIRIFNSLGQLKYYSPVIERKTVIDISNLTTGLYFIQLSNGVKNSTQKFTRQ